MCENLKTISNRRTNGQTVKHQGLHNLRGGWKNVKLTHNTTDKYTQRFLSRTDEHLEFLTL